MVQVYNFKEEREGELQNPTLIISTSNGRNISFVMNIHESEGISQTYLPLQIKGGFLKGLSSYFSRKTNQPKVPIT